MASLLLEQRGLLLGSTVFPKRNHYAKITIDELVEFELRPSDLNGIQRSLEIQASGLNRSPNHPKPFLPHSRSAPLTGQ